MIGRIAILASFFQALLWLSASADEKSSLADLVNMPQELLEKQDIAYLNLRCAEGLPGAESLRIDANLQKLDEWATRISFETGKNLYRYNREPGKFRNSEAFFRMAMLLTVVAQDFGCRYNPRRGVDPKNPEPADLFFANSQDLFIHGFLGSNATGTCSSFPVLYTALGRRLHYPVKLVTTKGHLFCRWDDGREQFNIEGTNGVSVHPDAYYRQWPYQIDEAFVRENGHLKSQDAKADLAGFLSVRASCLLANKRREEAREAITLAIRLMPDISYYQRFLNHLSLPTEAAKQ